MLPVDFDAREYVDLFVHRWENENTRRAYRVDMDRWLTWCVQTARDPIVGVRRTDVENWAKWLRGDCGNCAATVRHRINLLSQFFEICIDDDMVIKNPCRMVLRPRVRHDDSVRMALTSVEIRDMISVAKVSTPSDYAMVMIMSCMGLRVTEVCNLDIEDCSMTVDCHRCACFVRKGGNRAVVPIPPPVERAIDAAAGDRTTGPLILRRDGSRMTRRSADRAIKRLARLAKIDGISVSPHSLRHTFVVSGLDYGVPPRVMQLSAGHAQISTTFRQYDRSRVVLDDHAAYIVASRLAS